MISEDILKALRNNACHTLDLREVEFTPEDVQVLHSALTSNTSLQELLFNASLLNLDSLDVAFKIDRLLERNRAIRDNFVHLRAYHRDEAVDLDSMHQSLRALKKLMPSIVHTEAYRLLRSLTSHLGGADKEALTDLSTPYQSKKLQAIADKIFLRTLIAGRIFKGAPTAIQQARYLWIAYQLRHEVGNADYKTALSKLLYPRQELSPELLKKPANTLPGRGRLITYDSARQVAMLAHQTLVGSNPEAQYLNFCLDQRHYDRITFHALFRSPTFITTLSQAYPGVRFFRCLETQLFFKHLNLDCIMPSFLDARYCGGFQASLTERYRFARQQIDKLVPHPHLQETLSDIKENLVAYAQDFDPRINLTYREHL